MTHKNIDNTVNDNEKLMTRKEIIKYLKEKIKDFDEEELYYSGLPYSGSFASVNDFIPIAWDTPY